MIYTTSKPNSTFEKIMAGMVSDLGRTSTAEVVFRWKVFTIGYSNNIEVECSMRIENRTPCKEGFTGLGANCTDIDECNENKHNCDSNAFCRNTMGSYSCSCNNGYSGDGKICTACDKNANQPSQGICTCNTGYDGNGNVCTEIDECEEKSHNCDGNAVCTDTDGSFTCTCTPAYYGNGVSCQCKSRLYEPEFMI